MFILITSPSYNEGQPDYHWKTWVRTPQGLPKNHCGGKETPIMTITGSSNPSAALLSIPGVRTKCPKCPSCNRPVGRGNRHTDADELDHNDQTHVHCPYDDCREVSLVRGDEDGIVLTSLHQSGESMAT